VSLQESKGWHLRLGKAGRMIRTPCFLRDALDRLTAATKGNTKKKRGRRNPRNKKTRITKRGRSLTSGAKQMLILLSRRTTQTEDRESEQALREKRSQKAQLANKGGRRGKDLSCACWREERKPCLMNSLGRTQEKPKGNREDRRTAAGLQKGAGANVAKEERSKTMRRPRQPETEYRRSTCRPLAPVGPAANKQRKSRLKKKKMSEGSRQQVANSKRGILKSCETRDDHRRSNAAASIRWAQRTGRPVREGGRDEEKRGPTTPAFTRKRIGALQGPTLRKKALNVARADITRPCSSVRGNTERWAIGRCGEKEGMATAEILRNSKSLFISPASKANGLEKG